MCLIEITPKNTNIRGCVTPHPAAASTPIVPTMRSHCVPIVNIGWPNV